MDKSKVAHFYGPQCTYGYTNTRQMPVWFDLHFLSGQIAKIRDGSFQYWTGSYPIRGHLLNLPIHAIAILNFMTCPPQL